MFKTSYKSVYRVHTMEEALAIKIGDTHTDSMLYMIDVYDMILSINLHEMQYEKQDVRTLRNKCTDYLVRNYHDMYVPIPGCLIGWTQSMFVWIIILSLIDIEYRDAPFVLDDDYIKQHSLRVFDKEPGEWDFSTFISMMDIISLKWKTLKPCRELTGLLEVMWRVCAKYTLYGHSREVLNVSAYTMEMGEHVRLTETGMMIGLSRFYWFHQTMRQFLRWPIDHMETPPHIFDTWIKKETKHFVTRRFRDDILKTIWNSHILYGDKEISAHDELGDTVSSFTSMYARWPSGYINYLQKLVMYSEYEEIIEFLPVCDIVHMHMISSHFKNVYNVDWMKYFVVEENQQWKHMDGIERSMVPLVLYRYGEYGVFYKGTVYNTGTMEDAFITWCTIIRDKCHGKCYETMDFTSLLDEIFQVEEVNNERIIEGFYEIDDL